MDQTFEYGQLIIDVIRYKLPLNLFPRHDSHKFTLAAQNKKIDRVYDEGEEIGFMIKGDPTFYEVDEELGFFEPNGCYYNKNFEPAGWWVKDKKNKEHFYNLEGILEAVDDEEETQEDKQYLELKKQFNDQKIQQRNIYDFDPISKQKDAQREIQKQIDQLYLEEKKHSK